MDIRKQMDTIYKDMPLKNIPWNLSTPPQLLIDAVNEGKIKPCKTVDLGCGAGNYSVWLAQQGFEVTGIDISAEAIRHANKLATAASVSCRFEVRDLLGDLNDFHNNFDFALDWEVLHHIFPDNRPQFIKNIYNILRPEGICFSLCFHEDDPAFGGAGKFRKTPLGTTLYFSSEEELTQLLKPFFDIIELKAIEVPGKYTSHIANVAWLKRK